MRLCILLLAASAVACGNHVNQGAADDGDTDNRGDHDKVTVVDALPVCTAPFAAVTPDASAHVVGGGNASTCTQAALQAAVGEGGQVVFNCGPDPITISITSTINFPKLDTLIDGGGLITLDGGGTTRIFRYDGQNYRVGTVSITLQNLTLKNGRATGTAFPQGDEPCPQGVDKDGGGGAILFNDGKLHVVNVVFDSNQAGQLGPDVAGGAAYVTGALEAIFVGCKFTNNSAANGGAIGALNAQLDVYNSTFDSNAANGHGANYSYMCVCSVNSNAECGSGGNGGGISMDGGDDTTHTFCGSVFANNTGGQKGFGGGIFRTPDKAKQVTAIDRCTFDSNVTPNAGGAFYMHNTTLQLHDSAIVNNTSTNGAGGIWVDNTTLDVYNVTVANNGTNTGLGGGMFIAGGNDGTLRNITVAGNHIDGLPTNDASYFFGGIGGFDPVSLYNSIIANNTTHDPYNPVQCQSNPFSGTHVIQWPQTRTGSSDDPPCVASVTYADPQLGALADNSGPTETMLPATNGPAAGASDSAQCPDHDQRGNPRAQPCTAGAVEVQ